MSTTEESIPLPGITERIQLRARDMKYAALRGMRRAMQSIRPDPEPLDYDHFADERRFYQQLLREQRHGGHGSVNNGASKIMWILIAGLVTLNISAIGWFATSLISLREDVAVIKCQLAPTCQKVQVRGQ